MYEFRKVSDRMLSLHKRIRGRVIRYDSERAEIITKADKWMTFATHSYYDLCMEFSSRYCDYYRAGLYGAADHVHQGYVTWVTPHTS